MMDSLQLIADSLCLLLDDIRPLSCVTSGLVATAQWRVKAEQLWPGAAGNLVGEPKSQVRLLCGYAPAISAPIQQMSRTCSHACESECSVLLVVTTGDRNLWRGALRIDLQARKMWQGNDDPIPTRVNFAEFTLPRAVAGTLEAAIMQGDESNSTLRPGIPDCGVTCQLQLWRRGLEKKLHVIQPLLLPDALRYDRYVAGGRVGTLEFRPLTASGGISSSVDLLMKTYRVEASSSAAHDAVTAKIWLSGILDDTPLARFLDAFQHVYQSDQYDPIYLREFHT